MRRLVLASALFFSACGGFGSASVTGTVGGYGFNLATVYGWVDATREDNTGQQVQFIARDQPILDVVMTGAAFDPEQDMRFLNATDLENLAQDARERGMITFTINNYAAVMAGANLAKPGMAGPNDPSLDVAFTPALTQLKRDASYPTGLVPPIGSNITYGLTLDTAGKMRGENVSGTLTISVATRASDPSGSVTGTYTVKFSARLISERVAECNNRTDRPTAVACESAFPTDGN